MNILTIYALAAIITPIYILGARTITHRNDQEYKDSNITLTPSLKYDVYVRAFVYTSCILVGLLLLILSETNRSLLSDYGVGLDEKSIHNIEALAIILLSLPVTYLIALVVRACMVVVRNYHHENDKTKSLQLMPKLLRFIAQNGGALAAVLMTILLGMLSYPHIGVLVDAKTTILVDDDLAGITLDLQYENIQHLNEMPPDTDGVLTSDWIDQLLSRNKKVVLLRTSKVDDTLESISECSCMQIRVTAFQRDRAPVTLSWQTDHSSVSVSLRAIRKELASALDLDFRDSSSLVLRSASDRAVSQCIIGLQRMRERNMTSTMQALESFERASALDSTYIMPILGKALCLLLYMDSWGYSQWELDLIMPDYRIRDRKSCLSAVGQLLVQAHSMEPRVVSHPYYLSASCFYRCAKAMLMLYDMGGQLVVNDEAQGIDELTAASAIGELKQSVNLLVQNVNAAPGSRVLAYNLSVIYNRLSMMYYYADKLDSAIFYNGLAERAALRNVDLSVSSSCGTSLVASCKYQLYIIGGMTSPTLLDESERLARSVIECEESMFSECIILAESHYLLACIAAHRGELDRAGAELRKVQRYGMFDVKGRVLQECIFPGDFKAMLDHVLDSTITTNGLGAA